jgi:hypothetical protein
MKLLGACFARARPEMLITSRGILLIMGHERGKVNGGKYVVGGMDVMSDR